MLEAQLNIRGRSRSSLLGYILTMNPPPFAVQSQAKTLLAESGGKYASPQYVATVEA